MVPDGKRNQPKAGIRDAGHSRISHQSHARASLQVEHKLWSARHLIVFLVADSARAYPVMIQQLLGLPRILTGNKVGFLEHAQSSQSDVVKVPDRCADQI